MVAAALLVVLTTCIPRVGTEAAAGAPRPVASCGANCTKHVFPDAVQSHGARCLDGSPPGLYFRPGRGAGRRQFIIYSHGGSWCYKLTGADKTWDCGARSKTYEGSSAPQYQSDLGPTRNNMAAGIMDPNCDMNPVFCEWSVVYLMYCDGMSFAGNRTEPHTLVDGSLLWSRGRANLFALYDRLLSPTLGFGLADATRVIVTGASAGGFSAVYHCDRIRALVPAAIPLHCVSDAGFWPDFPDANGAHTWRAQVSMMVELHNASAGLDASCVGAHPADPAFCAHPPNSLPYVANPLFISSSRQDPSALDAIVNAKTNLSAAAELKLQDCLFHKYADCGAKGKPIVDAWTADITRLLSPAVSSTRMGFYIDNCHRHHNIDGNYSFRTKVKNTSLVAAVASWALGGGGPTKLNDSAIPGSNPTCAFDDANLRAQPGDIASPGCRGCASAARCNASFVDASCFLAHDNGDGIATTRALATAIASGAGVVSVPGIGKPWVVEPIAGVSFASPSCHGGYLDHPMVFCLGKNFSHRTLRFEPGAVVEARRGAFHGLGDSLLKSYGATDITIIGHGATLRMHREDYRNSSLCE